MLLQRRRRRLRRRGPPHHRRAAQRYRMRCPLECRRRRRRHRLQRTVGQWPAKARFYLLRAGKAFIPGRPGEPSLQRKFDVGNRREWTELFAQGPRDVEVAADSASTTCKGGISSAIAGTGHAAIAAESLGDDVGTNGGPRLRYDQATSATSVSASALKGPYANSARLSAYSSHVPPREQPKPVHSSTARVLQHVHPSSARVLQHVHPSSASVQPAVHVTCCELCGVPFAVTAPLQDDNIENHQEPNTHHRDPAVGIGLAADQGEVILSSDPETRRELHKRLSHVSQGHVPYWSNCESCNRSRGLTPARMRQIGPRRNFKWISACIGRFTLWCLCMF